MIWALWHGALSCWKYIRRWVHCSHKGMDMVRNNTQAGWIHGFMLFTPNSDPIIWMLQHKSRLIRPGNVFQSSIVQFWWSLCELYPPCAVLIWPERHPVWSSAAGVHLLQGSTCCEFRDGILHTLVVTMCYVSYCYLSIISNQSVHSPLTSDINKAFSSTQLPLKMIYWKIPVYQQCLKYSDQSVWHQQPFNVQSHLNPFLPRSDARFELQQVVFTTSRCLNALSSSMWLDD